MARKLTDKVIGGIYEYYRTDNQEVVYRGSSEKDLEGLDSFHRKGHTYSTVSYTHLTLPTNREV